MSDTFCKLTETSDEDSPSLVLGHDNLGQLVISILSNGQEVSITLTEEQLRALIVALHKNA